VTRPHPDEILSALLDAGHNLREARRNADDAMAQIARWARLGKGMLTIEKMSQASGVPRQTIREKMKEDS
jgi:hypothetical protein